MLENITKYERERERERETDRGRQIDKNIQNPEKQI